MLLQIEQWATRSLTSRSAVVRRSTSSRGLLSRKKARRCALFAPMPGSRWSSVMSCVSGSGRGMPALHSWNLEPAEHPAHLLLHRLIGLAMRLGDRSDEQVLQHLHIVFRHDVRIERDPLYLLVAVHDDGDHAAAGGRLDMRFGHLLLQALLHLLRLFHHALDVHG